MVETPHPHAEQDGSTAESAKVVRLIISPVAHLPSLQRMGIETHGAVNVGGFSEGRRGYLDFHTNSVLLRAAR